MVCDQIGGTQVWAKAPTHTPLPPRTGWHIPWDAQSSQPGGLLVDPAPPSTPGAAAGGLRPAAGGLKPQNGGSVAADTAANPAQRLQKSTDDIDAATKDVASAPWKKHLELPDPTENDLEEAHRLLQTTVSKLAELCANLNRDIMECRKGGATAQPTVVELTKLIPRIKPLQKTAQDELVKVRQELANRKKDAALAEQAKKREEELALLKVREVEDAKAFAEMFPPIEASVKEVQEVCDALVDTASPFISNGTSEESDIQEELTNIEEGAAEALNGLQECRVELQAKITSATQYAPETRKTAVAELHKLKQIVELLHVRLASYKTFKTDFKNHVAAREALQDVSEQIVAVEAELEAGTEAVLIQM